jgi:hypothetical protein
MNTLVAKPVLQDKFWIVKDGNRKIGNIEVSGNTYNVNLNGKKLSFKNAEAIKKETKIVFETIKMQSNTDIPLYNQFPIPDTIYNSMMDVKRNLHLFTHEDKCILYHAAGWFKLNMNNINDEVIFCPKYMYIQRYKYLGPFKTKEEANAATYS